MNDLPIVFRMWLVERALARIGCEVFSDSVYRLRIAKVDTFTNFTPTRART